MAKNGIVKAWIPKEQYEVLNQDAQEKGQTFEEYLDDLVRDEFEKLKAREKTLKTGKVVLPRLRHH